MGQLGDGSGTRAIASADADAELHDDDELAAVIAAQIQSYTSTAPLPVVDPRTDPRLRPLNLDDDDDDPPSEPPVASHRAPARRVVPPEPGVRVLSVPPGDDPARSDGLRSNRLRSDGPASSESVGSTTGSSARTDDDLADPAQVTQSLPLPVAADRTLFSPVRLAPAAPPLVGPPSATEDSPPQRFDGSRDDGHDDIQHDGHGQDDGSVTAKGAGRRSLAPGSHRSSVEAERPPVMEVSPEPAGAPVSAAPVEPPPTEPISVQLRAELAPLDRVDLPTPLVDAGPMAVPAGLYEEWERTLRRIGQPAAEDAPNTENDDDPATAAGVESAVSSRPDDAEDFDDGADPHDAGREAPDADRSPVAVMDAPVGAGAAAPPDASVRSLVRPDPLPFPESPDDGGPAGSALSPSPASADRLTVASALPPAQLNQGSTDPSETDADRSFDLLQPGAAGERAPGRLEPDEVIAEPATSRIARGGAVDGSDVQRSDVHEPAVGDGAAAVDVAAMSSDAPAPVDRVGSWPALLAGLLGWATVLVSAPILLLGLLLGGAAPGEPATAAIGLGSGALLALPGSLRLANRAGVAGGVVEALRALLGAPAGTAASVLLVVARILAIGLLLLATDELASSFVTRTGALPSLPGGVTAVLAVLAVTTFGLIGALFRSRAATVVIGIVGFLGIVITLLLVALLTSADVIRAGGAPDARPLAAVAAAVFAVVVLLLGGGPGAALGRIAMPGSRWTALVGALIGAIVAGAAWVTVVQVASDDGIATIPADTLAGGIVDATAAQLAVPVGLAALVAVAAGVAVLARTGGDLVAGLVRVPGSRGPAGAAAALASVAVALGLVAAGVGSADVVARFGPIVLVPLAALAGFSATSPRLAVGGPGRPVAVVGLLLATGVGLAAVDGLVVATERGPLLAAVGVTGTPLAFGLGAALVVGALSGLVALIVGRPAQDAPPVGDSRADTVA